ncbi:hypothetical protein KC887_02485 [Candidatus Kaiserbacteria bacterium]|nr:hypothetical protein [Candidatus Kaiserbacteria bacterium]
MKPIFDRESMIAYIDLQIKKSKQVVIDTEDSPVKGDIRLHWYHIGAVETLTDIRQRLMADYRRAPESK